MRSNLASLRRFVWVLAALLSLSNPATAEPFRFGLIETAFSYTGTNAKDAQAALQVWVAQLSKLIPDESFKAEAIIYQDRFELGRAVSDGRIDAVTLPSLDYVMLRESVDLHPAVVSYGEDEKSNVSYLLMRRRTGSGDDVDHMRDGKLVIALAEIGDLGTMWLDLHLMRKGFNQTDRHFREVSYVTKASQAAMAVFFGQADVCLVTERSLKTMVEMNPQMGRDLEVIAESAEFLPAVLCFVEPASTPNSVRATDAMLRLHELREGRQALSLFKQSGLDRIGSVDLESVEQLVRDYDRALKGIAAR